MSSPVVYRTIREQIVDQLRREVLSGEIAEGQSLREQKLAERFGVSRGPIRDALLQLTQEGLLVGQANRGVRVSRGPSLEIQPLVVQLRRQIETHALRSVASSLGEPDYEQLYAILRLFEAACRRGKMSQVIEHDMAFHRWIVERPGDADLVQLWLQTIVRMRLRYTRHADLLDCWAEHQAIVNHLEQGAPIAALSALEANIL